MPPAATESIRDTVSGLADTVAKKLNIQSSSHTNGVTNGNGVATNGHTNGTNGHVKSEGQLHPLDPLTPAEIKKAADVVRAAYPPASPIHFKAITLDEPAKAAVITYLEAEHGGSPLPIVPRSAYVLYVTTNTNKTFEATVDFLTGKLATNVQIPDDCHAAADTSELVEIEEIALSAPEVKAELQRLNLPKDAIVACDPWTYGSDGEDDTTRKWQCYMYLRDPSHNHSESNHYAIPLDFSPRIDHATKKVDQIIRLPLFDTFDTTPQTDYVVPKGNEYHYDLAGSKRTGLKPYNVVQPEGPSYGIDGNIVEWQKWRFRVGFNYREGLTLHDIRYDGRSVFYRLSLSDMFVPYADPRAPYHRKSAFDFGDVGAGITANNLKLGCDCLGVIKVSLQRCVINSSTLTAGFRIRTVNL
jgi:primary-amine oxidase